MEAKWIPGEEVGAIRLGMPISTLNGQLDLHEDDELGTPDEPVYVSKDEEWEISVEDGVISSIDCYRWCIYNGTNLIGLKIANCLELLGCDQSSQADDQIWLREGNQDIYEIDHLGAMIWVRDGIVDSITINEIFAEDQETVIHPFREQ